MKNTDQVRDMAGSATDVIRDRASAIQSYLGDESAELRDLAARKAREAREYIQRRGPSGIGRDVASVAKDHPIATAATLFGLGFLTYRLFIRD
jgi:hypothetical protein